MHKRNITNSSIVVRFSYLNDIKGKEVSKEGDLGIRYQESLKDAFKRYSTKHNLNNKEAENYFYLEQGEKRIELEKDKRIDSLNLKSGDKILISSDRYGFNDVKKYKRELNDKIKSLKTKKLKKILLL